MFNQEADTEVTQRLLNEVPAQPELTLKEIVKPDTAEDKTKKSKNARKKPIKKMSSEVKDLESLIREGRQGDDDGEDADLEPEIRSGMLVCTASFSSENKPFTAELKVQRFESCMFDPLALGVGVDPTVTLSHFMKDTTDVLELRNTRGIYKAGIRKPYQLKYSDVQIAAAELERVDNEAFVAAILSQGGHLTPPLSDVDLGDYVSVTNAGRAALCATNTMYFKEVFETVVPSEDEVMKSLIKRQVALQNSGVYPSFPEMNVVFPSPFPQIEEILISAQEAMSYGQSVLCHSTNVCTNQQLLTMHTAYQSRMRVITTTPILRPVDSVLIVRSPTRVRMGVPDAYSTLVIYQTLYPILAINHSMFTQANRSLMNHVMAENLFITDTESAFNRAVDAQKKTDLTKQNMLLSNTSSQLAESCLIQFAALAISGHGMKVKIASIDSKKITSAVIHAIDTLVTLVFVDSLMLEGFVMHTPVIPGTAGQIIDALSLANIPAAVAAVQNFCQIANGLRTVTTPAASGKPLGVGGSHVPLGINGAVGAPPLWPMWSQFIVLVSLLRALPPVTFPLAPLFSQLFIGASKPGASTAIGSCLLANCQRLGCDINLVAPHNLTAMQSIADDVAIANAAQAWPGGVNPYVPIPQVNIIGQGLVNVYPVYERLILPPGAATSIMVYTAGWYAKGNESELTSYLHDQNASLLRGPFTLDSEVQVSALSQYMLEEALALLHNIHDDCFNTAAVVGYNNIPDILDFVAKISSSFMGMMFEGSTKDSIIGSILANPATYFREVRPYLVNIVPYAPLAGLFNGGAPFSNPYIGNIALMPNEANHHVEILEHHRHHDDPFDFDVSVEDTVFWNTRLPTQISSLRICSVGSLVLGKQGDAYYFVFDGRDDPIPGSQDSISQGALVQVAVVPVFPTPVVNDVPPRVITIGDVRPPIPINTKSQILSETPLTIPPTKVEGTWFPSYTMLRYGDKGVIDSATALIKNASWNWKVPDKPVNPAASNPTYNVTMPPITRTYPIIGITGVPDDATALLILNAVRRCLASQPLILIDICSLNRIVPTDLRTMVPSFHLNTLTSTPPPHMSVQQQLFSSVYVGLDMDQAGDGSPVDPARLNFRMPYILSDIVRAKFNVKYSLPVQGPAYPGLDATAYPGVTLSVSEPTGRVENTVLESEEL